MDFASGAPHTCRKGGISEVANLSRRTQHAFPFVGFFVGIADGSSINTKTLHDTSTSAKLIAADLTSVAPVTPHIRRKVANLSGGTGHAFPLIGFFIGFTHRAHRGAKSSLARDIAEFAATDRTGGAPVAPHKTGEVANLSGGTQHAFPLIGFFAGIADARSRNTRTATIDTLVTSASAIARLTAMDSTSGAPHARRIGGGCSEVANLSGRTQHAFPLVGFFIGIA
jgi:hypothetical protein